MKEIQKKFKAAIMIAMLLMLPTITAQEAESEKKEDELIEQYVELPKDLKPMFNPDLFNYIAEKNKVTYNENGLLTIKTKSGKSLVITTNQAAKAEKKPKFTKVAEEKEGLFGKEKLTIEMEVYSSATQNYEKITVYEATMINYIKDDVIEIVTEAREGQDIAELSVEMRQGQRQTIKSKGPANLQINQNTREIDYASWVMDKDSSASVLIKNGIKTEISSPSEVPVKMFLKNSVVSEYDEDTKGRPFYFKITDVSGKRDWGGPHYTPEFASYGGLAQTINFAEDEPTITLGAEKTQYVQRIMGGVSRPQLKVKGSTKNLVYVKTGKKQPTPESAKQGDLWVWIHEDDKTESQAEITGRGTASLEATKPQATGPTQEQPGASVEYSQKGGETKVTTDHTKQKIGVDITQSQSASINTRDIGDQEITVTENDQPVTKIKSIEDLRIKAEGELNWLNDKRTQELLKKEDKVDTIRTEINILQEQIDQNNEQIESLKEQIKEIGDPDSEEVKALVGEGKELYAKKQQLIADQEKKGKELKKAEEEVIKAQEALQFTVASQQEAQEILEAAQNSITAPEDFSPQAIVAWQKSQQTLLKKTQKDLEKCIAQAKKGEKSCIEKTKEKAAGVIASADKALKDAGIHIKGSSLLGLAALVAVLALILMQLDEYD